MKFQQPYQWAMYRRGGSYRRGNTCAAGAAARVAGPGKLPVEVDLICHAELLLNLSTPVCLVFDLDPRSDPRSDLDLPMQSCC